MQGYGHDFMNLIWCHLFQFLLSGIFFGFFLCPAISDVFAVRCCEFLQSLGSIPQLHVALDSFLVVVVAHQVVEIFTESAVIQNQGPAESAKQSEHPSNSPDFFGVITLLGTVLWATGYYSNREVALVF